MFPRGPLDTEKPMYTLRWSLLVPLGPPWPPPGTPTAPRKAPRDPPGKRHDPPGGSQGPPGVPKTRAKRPGRVPGSALAFFKKRCVSRGKPYILRLAASKTDFDVGPINKVRIWGPWAHGPMGPWPMAHMGPYGPIWSIWILRRPRFPY